MSEWYHYAILEMTEMEGFKFDHTWIANQLNISVPESRRAVERLLRLELLEINNETIVKTQRFVTNGDDFLTSSAHKQLQRHVLQKALEAIDTVPIEEKDISSITMAIDVDRIPEAKKIITRFRRELCGFLEDGKKERVYNLGIQLYPISKGIRK
ncbi:MAG: TIGR02147 family protein [Chryseobacterium sp.]|nr:MAG: TIGR02147 family protein [Chryseobacterium sp.]